MAAGSFDETRGIEIGDFVLSVAAGKLIFFSKQKPDEQVTFNLWTESRVLDVHRTIVSKNHRETLFAIYFDQIPALLDELLSLISIEQFPLLIRPLRFGWRRRQFMYLLDGQFLNEEQFLALSKRNRRRRMVLPQEDYVANLKPMVDYWDCIESESSAFGVCVLGKNGRVRQVGVAFKLPSPNDSLRIGWVKFKDIGLLIETLMREWESIVRKYEISKEEYQNYDFLT